LSLGIDAPFFTAAKYLKGLEPVAWFCNSSYLGGRNLELLRSLSPGEVLPNLSSIRNSLVSATDAAKVQFEGLGKLWEGFNLQV